MLSLIVGAVLTTVGGAAFVSRRSNDAHAQDVEVREDGEVVTTATQDEALRLLSERVGFKVLVPRSLPAGASRLLYVEAFLGPPGLDTLKISRLVFVEFRVSSTQRRRSVARNSSTPGSVSTS